MSVSNGQSGNATVFNAAYMSRTTNTSTTGTITLNEAVATSITDLQAFVADEIADTVGFTEGDPNRKNYSSNNLITNGDDHKVAIGKLDQGIQDVDDKTVDGPVSATADGVARYDSTTGKLIKNSGVTIDDSDNMVIPGDLTVNGTTTTINTATLDVADTNITVNDGGNDASSEGAGLTVERTGTDGSFVYEDALASKFKIGALAAEIEVTNVSSAQTLTNKTIAAGSNTISGLTHGSEVDDPTTGVHGVAGTVVGTSDSQTLTNKTIAAGSNTISGLTHGGEVDDPSSGIHGVAGSVVGTTDAQVMTGKDIDGGTASDTSRLTIPKDTLTNLNALTDKEGTIAYDTAAQQVVFNDGVAFSAVDASAGAPATVISAIYNSNAGQSIPNNATTVVNFEDTILDTDSAVTIGAGWNFTVPSGGAGVYDIQAAVGFSNISVGNSGRLQITIRINGSAAVSDEQQIADAGRQSVDTATHASLAVSDTVDVTIAQSNGGARTLDANAFFNRISITRLGTV